MLIEPAQRILRIVEREGFFGELERVCGIEHHRQLFCAQWRLCSP